jgi:hypothetical protein
MRGGAPENPNIRKKMVELFNIDEVEQFLTNNNITIPADIDTITYLDFQRYLSTKDTSMDMTAIINFKKTFVLPST